MTKTPRGGLITAIEMLYVHGPIAQDALVDVLLEANEVRPQMPGFVSAAVLRSSDSPLERFFGLASARARRSSDEKGVARRRVANYVQWESEDLLRAADREDGLRGLVSGYRRWARSSAERLYDVRFVGNPHGGGVTTLGDLPAGVTAINEVSTTPEHQEDLLAFMVGVDRLAKEQPGYISSNIHLSRDGLCNLNFVQFESARAVAIGLPRVLWRISRERSDASLRGGMPGVGGMGTSDIHLYDVV